MADWVDVMQGNLDRQYQMQGGSPQDQARTALINQQAQSAAIANRVAQSQADARQRLADSYNNPDTSTSSQPLPGDPSLFNEAVESPQETKSGVAANAIGSGPQAPDSSGSSFTIDPAGTMAHMRARFAPVPAALYTPAEQFRLQQAMLSGDPTAAQTIQTQHAMRVDAQNQTRLKQARDEYDVFHGVATADNPLEALRLVDPDHAARFEQDGATPDQIRGWAAQLGSTLHVAAQLPVDIDPKTGIARDKESGEPIHGYDQAVGLDGESRIALSKAATVKQDVPNSDGTTSKLPTWQAEGAKSPEDWINQHLQLAASSAAGLPVGGTPSQGAVPGAPPQGAPRLPWLNGGPQSPGAGPAAGGPGPQAAPAPQAPPPQRAPAPASAPGPAPNPNVKLSPVLLAAASKPVTMPDGSTQPMWQVHQYPSAAVFAQHLAALADQHNTNHAVAAAGMHAMTQADANSGGLGTPAAADPVLSKALADPDYKLRTPPVRAGVTQSPAAAEQAKTTVAARKDLINDAQDATKTAAQALTYYQAAQAVLNSKGAPVTGPLGNIVAQASRAAGLSGGVDASNYQTLVKYLSNAALQNARQSYGQRMTQSEVNLQLNEMSPSAHMTDDAIRDLVATNVRSAQYAIDSASRVKKYLAAGNDPEHFREWNEQYYSESKAVNQAPSGNGGAASGGAPATKVINGVTYTQQNGKWYR